MIVTLPSRKKEFSPRKSESDTWRKWNTGRALSCDITPSTQEDLPKAPNCFIAVKGPDGSAAVAKRQACYEGALGERGILSLRSYGQSNLADDNNAYTFTSTYNEDALKMYTNHPLHRLMGRVSQSIIYINLPLGA